MHFMLGATPEDTSIRNSANFNDIDQLQLQAPKWTSGPLMPSVTTCTSATLLRIVNSWYMLYVSDCPYWTVALLANWAAQAIYDRQGEVF